MIRLFPIGFVLFVSFNTLAQSSSRDEEMIIKEIEQLVSQGAETSNDSSIILFKKALKLSQQINNPLKIYTAHSKLGNVYFNKSRNAESLNHYSRSAEISQNVLSIDYTAWAYNNMAGVYNVMEQKDSSLLYYQKALSLFESNSDSKNKAMVLINMAKVYRKMNQFEKALTYLYQAETILEENGLIRNLGSCYLTIALVNKILDNVDESLKYNIKALEISKSLKDTKGIGASLNNIGNIYSKKDQLDKALFYFFEAVKYKQEDKVDRSLAISINNIGKIYLKMDSLEMAEEYLNRALKIRKEIDHKVGIAGSMTALGELYYITNRYDASKKILFEALNLTDSINHENQYMEVLFHLKNLHQAIGKYELANYYFNEYTILKDTVQARQKNRQITELHFRYKSDKKEQQINFLKEKEQLQAAKIRTNGYLIFMLVALSLLMIALVIVLYNRYVIKKKANERIQILMRELHHRVKNNFQLVSSLLSLQSQRLQDPVAKEAVKRGEDRVKAMSLIHQNLYLDDEISEIDMHQYIVNLIRNLIHTNGFNENQIKIDSDIDYVKLDVDKAIPLGLIINELLSNAFKHAFIDHPNPELLVNFNCSEGKLNLSVGDNGSSNNKALLNKSGSFGLKMVHTLVRQLKAKLETHYKNGLRYQLVMEI